MIRLALGVILFSLTLLAGPGEGKDGQKVPLPTAKEFRRYVIKVIKSYPTNGTHRYYWPRKGGGNYAGTTRDLVYQGKVVAKGDEKGRCYCCGLTYEVFFRAWKLYCKKEKLPFRILNMTSRDLKKLRLHWYVATKDRSGCQGAIVKYKLGKKVPLKKAQSGDFVQIWRKNGSGHSVIFVNWVVKRGQIIGIRYWSTQKSTKGIGVHTEYTRGRRGVDLAKTYIGRVGR